MMRTRLDNVQNEVDKVKGLLNGFIGSVKSVGDKK